MAAEPKSIWIPRGETARAIRTLADLKGESMTKVVGNAVQAALARLEAAERGHGGSKG